MEREVGYLYEQMEKNNISFPHMECIKRDLDKE